MIFRFCWFWAIVFLLGPFELARGNSTEACKSGYSRLSSQLGGEGPSSYPRPASQKNSSNAINEIVSRYESLLKDPQKVSVARLRVLQEAAQQEWLKLAAEGKAYRTLNMRKEYLGEHARGGLVWDDDARPVKYFTSTERKQFEVQVGNDGLIRNQKGELLSNCDFAARGTAKFACTKSIFVMSGDGKIYVHTGEGTADWAIQHSSFMAGLPVASAGEIRVSGGRILTLNRHSGHYGPPEGEFLQVVSELQSRGAKLSETKVNTYVPTKKRAPGPL